MEPTAKQFSNTYYKGKDQSGLNARAVTQSIEESDVKRKLTGAQEHERDVASGVQGAKNIVDLNPTVNEAMENPSTLGGPVSGAALAKLKANKVSSKKTKERELKRR